MMRAGSLSIRNDKTRGQSLRFCRHKAAGGTGRRAGPRLADCKTPRGRVA